MALLVGQFRVEFEPGLVLTRTLPSIVEDDWWITWVVTGPVLRQQALAEGVNDDADPFFGFLRSCQAAIQVRQSTGQPLPHLFAGGGSESGHELRLRFPVGLTAGLDVRYVWQGDVGRETVTLPTL